MRRSYPIATRTVDKDSISTIRTLMRLSINVRSFMNVKNLEYNLARLVALVTIVREFIIEDVAKVRYNAGSSLEKLVALLFQSSLKHIYPKIT